MELDKKKKKKGVFDQERTKFKAPKFTQSSYQTMALWILQ